MRFAPLTEKRDKIFGSPSRQVFTQQARDLNFERLFTSTTSACMTATAASLAESFTKTLSEIGLCRMVGARPHTARGAAAAASRGSLNWPLYLCISKFRLPKDSRLWPPRTRHESHTIVELNERKLIVCFPGHERKDRLNLRCLTRDRHGGDERSG